MKKQTNFIKGGSAVLLSGALVLAFSPAVFAPTAFAGEKEVAAVIAAIDVYRTNGDASVVTEQAAEDVTGAMETYKVTLQELPEAYQIYVLQCQLYNAKSDLEEVNQELKTAQTENSTLRKQVNSLEKQLSQAQAQASSAESTTLKTKTKVSNFSVAAPGMGKLTASWTVKNPVEGIAYQIRYAKLGSKSVTTTAKSTKKTFKKLSGGATYTFRVRAYKKIGGKNVYSAWSKKASAQVVPVYRKGSYTVKGDFLNVRETASQAKSTAVLISIPRGTKVQVTKVKIAGGAAWGKLTYKGQTGWVQMQYLK